MPMIMLAGKTHCGKTTLCQALGGLERIYKKTQTIEIIQSTMDTPGEYLENKRFHHALLVSSFDADCIVLMQDCTDGTNAFPPGFASLFQGKPVLGVVSKVAAGTRRHIERAEAMLTLAGVSSIHHLDSIAGLGIEAFSLFVLHRVPPSPPCR